MMIALGEMAALFPVSGGFTHYASRFIDPAMGFALGINYWYSYAITMPTEIVAASIVISYWDVSLLDLHRLIDRPPLMQRYGSRS